MKYIECMCLRINRVELLVFSLEPSPWKGPVIVVRRFIIPIADEKTQA